MHVRSTHMQLKYLDILAWFYTAGPRISHLENPWQGSFKFPSLLFIIFLPSFCPCFFSFFSPRLRIRVRLCCSGPFVQSSCQGTISISSRTIRTLYIVQVTSYLHMSTPATKCLIFVLLAPTLFRPLLGTNSPSFPLHNFEVDIIMELFKRRRCHGYDCKL